MCLIVKKQLYKNIPKNMNNFLKQNAFIYLLCGETLPGHFVRFMYNCFPERKHV